MPTKDSAISRNPVAQTALAPNRSASPELRGAMSAMPSATGMSAAPLCSGRVAADALQVVDEVEGRAQQGEEVQAQRGGGRGEGGVAEEADVERGVGRAPLQPDEERRAARRPPSSGTSTPGVVQPAPEPPRMIP